MFLSWAVAVFVWCVAILQTILIWKFCFKRRVASTRSVSSGIRDARRPTGVVTLSAIDAPSPSAPLSPITSSTSLGEMLLATEQPLGTKPAQAFVATVHPDGSMALACELPKI